MGYFGASLRSRKFDFDMQVGNVTLSGGKLWERFLGWKVIQGARNKGWLNDGKHGQGTHWTKKGADSLAENNPNAPKFICPICLPKPKNSGFQ